MKKSEKAVHARAPPGYPSEFLPSICQAAARTVVRLLLAAVVVVMVVMVMMMMLLVLGVTPPRALTTSPLVLAVVGAAAAEPPAVLLVPRAEGLAAKGQLIVVNDGGLDPGGARGVDLRCGGVEGLVICCDVVVRR